MPPSLNLATFFAQVRRDLFDGGLSGSQVSGIEHTIETFDQYGTGDRRHLAYALATEYHETGRRMQPVREGFAQTDAGARASVAKLHAAGRISKNYALPGSYGNSFYGRGSVQLTFEDNYRKMGAALGIDLVRYPDSALDAFISKRILIEGMTRGLTGKGDFTKFAVEDFISGDRCDYVGARKVVNGTDKAALIASYATSFDSALKNAGMPVMSKTNPPTATRPVLPASPVVTAPIPVQAPKPTPGVVQAPPATTEKKGLLATWADNLRAAFPNTPKKDS